MKALRIHEYKQAPTLDDVPQPDLESDLDVIVRVGGAGVCRTDLHVIDGWLKDVMPVELPFTLGHENAGWVEAVGKRVTSTKPGDTVIVHPLRTCGTCWGCRQAQEMYCSAGVFPGVTADGGYAEYLRTTERAIVVLPEGTDPSEIAPHADAGLTAFRAVRKAAVLLGPGQVAAVIGTGGLGHIGIQLLHEMTPARVIAIDKSESGRTLAEHAGADWVLESARDAEKLAEITGGVGADVVIDFVGEGDAPQQAVALLKQGGTYLVVGYGGELQLPTLELVLKEIRVEGNLVGSYTDLSELMRLVAQDRIKLSTKKFQLSEAVKALNDLDRGNMPGRGVLVP